MLIMKKIFALLTLAAILALPVYSQTNTAPKAGFLDNILTNFSLTAQNYVAIGYGAYDRDTKGWGYGGAILYMASTNFWTGVRIQSLNGKQTTAAVQGQLQVPFHALTLTWVPFVESSVGLGQDELYANAGAGLLVMIHRWKIGMFDLGLGVLGDYEHYVMGDRSGNQINAGGMLNLKW